MNQIRQPSTRRHDIDALRVLAFSLLILYHVGMFYVGEWGWHVKSEHRSETLQWFMLLVNQWRMPLIFLVSGLASSFMFRKLSPGTFARQRFSRLFVPLVFGMLVVVPPQAYFQALANGVIEPGYGTFLLRYFTFQGWPEGAFDGSDIGITWNHLWYLPYLLFYTMLLVPAAAWLRGRGSRWHDRLIGIRGWRLVLLPVLPLLLYGMTLYPVFGGASHSLFDDWYAHAMYFTFFAYGYVLGDDPGIWSEIRRLRRPLLVGAFALYALFIGIGELVPDEPDHWQLAYYLPVIYLNRWVWILALLGWAYALLNRPMGWLRYANEAVYPWYVLHQTITVVAGYYLSRMALGPVVEPVLVLSLTIGGCLLIHELIIRRVGWLRPLFGLRPRPGSSARAPGAAGATV